MRAVHRRRAGPRPLDELWLVEHDPVFTQGLAWQGPSTCAGGRRHPGGGHQPGRPNHLPRAGSGGGLSRWWTCAACASTSKSLSTAWSMRCSRCWRGHADHGPPGWPAPPASMFVWLPRAPMRQLTDAPVPPTTRSVAWARWRRWASRSATTAPTMAWRLNVAMDLAPFSRINPCGYAGLATVDLGYTGCFHRLGHGGAAARTVGWSAQFEP